MAHEGRSQTCPPPFASEVEQTIETAKSLQQKFKSAARIRQPGAI